MKTENKLIGTIDIRQQVDFYDIGYILNANYQGFGYASESLHLLIDEIFKKTSLLEVFLVVDGENLKSNKLAQKFVFKIQKVFWEFNEKLKQNRQLLLYVLKKTNWTNRSLNWEKAI